MARPEGLTARGVDGGAKAGWILLIFIVPFLGALIYIIARPKMTAQDKQDMAKMQEAQRRMSDEFEEMKKRAMMPLN